jgi:hypothetical protein
MTKTILLAIAIFLGGAMFVYGGYDDSPGGQGLGLLVAIGATVWLIRGRR